MTLRPLNLDRGLVKLALSPLFIDEDQAYQIQTHVAETLNYLK